MEPNDFGCILGATLVLSLAALVYCGAVMIILGDAWRGILLISAIPTLLVFLAFADRRR